MHAIRSAARRQAYYGGDGPTEEGPLRGLNLLRRVRTSGPQAPSQRHTGIDQVLRSHGTDHDLNVPPHRSASEGHSSLQIERIRRQEEGDHADSPQEKAAHVPDVESHPSSHERVETRHRFRILDYFRRSAPSATTENKSIKSARITLRQQFEVLVFAWINLLYCFVPAGFAVYYTGQRSVVVFVVNFVALFPTIATLGFAMEEMNKYFGDTVGALVNISFGNAAQLITSILLLHSRQIQVLQASLLGTILQNLLLMLGASFFVGGLRWKEQHFNANVAQTISMFLLLAVLSLVLPTASKWLGTVAAEKLAEQSRGTAVVIIVSYCLWLIFQLKTHRAMFTPATEKAVSKRASRRVKDEASGAPPKVTARSATSTGSVVNKRNLIVDDEEEDEEDEHISLSLPTSIVTIAICTTLLAFNTEFVTNTIQSLLAEHNITTSFLGVVILPLLNNDPLSIQQALKDKMDVSIALCCERCMQTALLIVPLVVLIAWIMGIDAMTLDFDSFSVVALFASVIILTYVVQEGRSNWLTGALLLKVFVIVAIALYFRTEPVT